MERKRSRGRPKKPKEEGSSPSSPKRQQICFLHYDSSKCDTFVLLSGLENPTERLLDIHNIRDRRQSDPIGSKHRMDSVCEQIPNQVDEGYGYHRDCYQHFINHLDRLQTPGHSDGPSTAKINRRRSSADKITLFAKDCIFCNKEGKIAIKKSAGWTTQTPSKFVTDAWKTVVECAEKKKDEKLLVRIRGYDLFAAEAHFHSSCKKKYLQDPDYWRSTDSEAKLHQEELEEAHERAFRQVCDRVSIEVIDNNGVLKLVELLKMYTTALDETNFPNAEYRGEKLKAKLQSTYGEQITFCQIEQKGQYKSQLIYSSSMKLEKAVQSAFILGSRDTLSDVAEKLRNVILNAFENSGALRWPPTAEHIDKSDGILPQELSNFLKLIFSGKVKYTSTQTNRLVSSIGQDICRAVTNGEWKMPKHILLCMTLRHLYRSKQLTTLLNRLGHCESHSFSIELETAIATALEQTSSLLSAQIIREPNAPSVFHSEFDNFDQLVNTLRGVDSIHTAHGIMIQEVQTDGSEDHGGTVPVVPLVPRSRERSIKLSVQEQLPDCYVGQRKSPSYPVTNRVYPGSEGSVKLAIEKSIVWLFIRIDSSAADQEVPGWTGFISVTGSKPTKLTTIDYYPVINHPITEYRTVQECLRYAEEATKEVGQEYVVTTFDLGVCMKALPLIWNNTARYEKHIIMIGTFHLICAYLRMVGKKMAGSGLSEVMLEAGLIGTGSIKGVLTGKHYDRAMHCHKIVLESLERLLFGQFLFQKGMDDIFEGLPESSKLKIQDLVHSPSEQILEQVMNDTALVAYIQEYCRYRDKVREGEQGKTAQFWISYMDHVWLVLSLIRAVKTNDFLLYTDCLHQMSDLFFSFDGQNYARYLTFFSVFVANIEETHPGATDVLQRGAISVARSFIPGNRCAVDKTMEETFMKHAKSHGGAGGSGAGITGISSNYEAYQRWVRTTHERSKYVEATLNMADMLTDTDSSTRHRDLRPAEIQKSEQEVCETQEAIKGFINPFTIDEKDNLYCISSGARVPDVNENDILMAETRGKGAKEDFIKDRLEANDKFFEPVKRVNLKTMEHMGKTVKIKSSKNKVVEYRQQGNIAIQLLVKSQKPQNQIDMADLMKYPLTPVPCSIGSADGSLAKNDKSKGFKYLVGDTDIADVPKQDDSLLVVEDGNALFHCMREVPSNFKQIAEKLFNMMPKKVDVIFSTDMYLEDSVKSMERVRRGCGEKLLIQGENTKKPADWKSFLTNDENKKQLVQVIREAWNSDSYAQKLEGRKVTLICDGVGYCYTSLDGEKTARTRLEEMQSTQEETDSRVVLYCMYAKEQGYKIVQVKTPDSDIFFILLHYIGHLEGITVLFDTGSGNNRKLINMTEFGRAYTEEYRAALLGLHAYCGCDSTSAFKGKGHVKPLKILEKMPRYVVVLKNLGMSWNVPQSLIDELEEFTCAMYGKARFRSVNELRLFRIKEKCDDKPIDALRNVEMAILPPCRNCLIQHIRRVNYQVSIWKNAHIAQPNIPTPSEDHGWTRVNEMIEPLWIQGDILPSSMVDMLQDTLEEESSEEDEEVEEEIEEMYDWDNE